MKPFTPLTVILLLPFAILKAAHPCDKWLGVFGKGFAIIYDPACRVVHRVAPANRGRERQVFYATRNSLWLIRTYYTGPGKAYLLASRAIIGLSRALQFAEPAAYLRGLREGFSTPVKRRPLPARLHRTFAPFWRQNSLLHQLLRRA